MLIKWRYFFDLATFLLMKPVSQLYYKREPIFNLLLQKSSNQKNNTTLLT